MRWIICYDIADNRRRACISKYLEGWGRRIQKSIFECELNPAELRKVMERIDKDLDPDEDRCVAFRQCEGCTEAKLSIGKSIEPEWETVMIA